MFITMVLLTRGVNIFIYLSFKLIGMELQKNKTKIKFLSRFQSEARNGEKLIKLILMVFFTSVSRGISAQIQNLNTLIIQVVLCI